MGQMVLLPVKLGDGCVVGKRTQICAGANIPPRTVFGPQSSSYEVNKVLIHTHT